MADTRQKLGALTKQVISFEDMADLPDFESKRKALLRRCEVTYAMGATGRNYVDKNGIEHAQPDTSACVKCIELGARLLGVIAEAEKMAKSDDPSRGVEIAQLLSLLRSLGYKIQEPPKAA